MADDVVLGPPIDESDAVTLGPPIQPPQQQPEGTEGPMPGSFRAFGQGVATAWGRGKQTEEALTGQKPEDVQETSPAAQPLEWSDIPSLNILPKAAYQLGKNAPSLAAGFFGGAAGTAIAGPGGALPGGALGVAFGSALQEIGPYLEQELKKTPNDQDGAWARAWRQAEISGAFSGASWTFFPMKLFQGPLKQAAFQAFGVQPAVGMAEQATQNIAAGQPVTKDLGQAYTQSALGTVVPAVGHALVAGPGTRPTLDPTSGHKPQFTGNTIDPIAERTEGLAPSYKEINMTIPPKPPEPDPGLMGRIAKKLTGIWQGNFQPESVNDVALQAYGSIRKYFSTLASRSDSTFAEYKDAHFAAERFAAEQGQKGAIEFMSYVSNQPTAPGWKLPPYMAPYVPFFKDAMKMVMEEDDKMGFDYGDYNKNEKGYGYFPTQWDPRDQDQAAKMFMQRTAGRGQPGFQKPRTLELIRDGDAQGLKLATPNVADLVVNRLMASAEGRARLELLGDMNNDGIAQPLDNEGMIAKAQSEGWHIIKDPTGRPWGIHPDARQIWDRAMADRGLWSDPGVVGDLFKKWMDLKNTYVPLKLMVSGFHPLHVAHINFVNGMAQGWTELTSGRPIKAAAAFTNGITGMLTSMIPARTIQKYTGLDLRTKGVMAMDAWKTPEHLRTPWQKAIVKLFNEGGQSPQLAEELRTADSRAWRDHWINGEYARALLPAVKNGVVNTIQKPIFEHWIPALKSAAYLQAAESLADRRPDIFANDNLRRSALGAIGKSIDNRYGEMFYKGVIWNKMIRDAGIGSFLSMGWNLGFLREGVGGILEPFFRDAIQTPTEEAIYAAKNKFTYSFLYAGTAMAIGGLMTYMMTGKSPEDMMDYVFPRTGRTNADLSPSRLSTMFYTREAPMLAKHAQEQQSAIGGLAHMLYNKTLIEPFKELYQNRDYYGFEIMNPSSPWYQQMWQMSKYIMSDAFNPISVTGAKKALQAQGMWDERDPLYTKMWKIMSTTEGQLSVAGFGPAPTYVSRSDTLNRLSYMFQHYVAPELRPQAEQQVMEMRADARKRLGAAIQNKDQAAAARASKDLSDLHASAKSLTPDKYMFQKLPYSAQAEFLQELNKEDFKHYYPMANTQARADPAVEALRKRYYQ